MSLYQACVRINQCAIWHKESDDKHDLMGYLLSRMEKEKNAVEGLLSIKEPSAELLFQCRKSAHGAIELLHVA